MKNMKVLILVFGILGAISLFIPMEGVTMFAFLKLAGMGYLVPVLGGFVLAAVMGGMGLAKPPMQQWQAGVCRGLCPRLRSYEDVGRSWPHHGRAAAGEADDRRRVRRPHHVHPRAGEARVEGVASINT